MDEKKITRQKLREMEAGDTMTVTLSDYASVESGKNVAYAFGKVEGYKYTTRVEKVEEGWNLTVKKENLN